MWHSRQVTCPYCRLRQEPCRLSRTRPVNAGRARPTNLATSCREGYIALNDRVFTRLAEKGHDAVRAAHGAVFQYLDDTGTTVSTLAERAQTAGRRMSI